MPTGGSNPISLNDAFDGLRFFGSRTPTSTAAEAAGAFGRLAEYRDGAVFVGHWAGTSEWERHPAGDEVVMIAGGETVITLLEEGAERSVRLVEGDLVVVPQNTWHRFETTDEVKVMTVTPQQTDHSVERPRR